MIIKGQHGIRILRAQEFLQRYNKRTSSEIQKYVDRGLGIGIGIFKLLVKLFVL